MKTPQYRGFEHYQPRLKLFAYFGGKSEAAPIIWEHLGDPGAYYEPFAGSLAALLRRPAWHTGVKEIVNDNDGGLTNFWRALQLNPTGLAKLADRGVSELDLYAAELQAHKKINDPDFIDWLAGDIEHYDLATAAHWLYATTWKIGDLFSNGPYTIDTVTGIRKRGAPGSGISLAKPQGSVTAGYSSARGDELIKTFETIAARLKYVTVYFGDWQRILTPSNLGKMYNGGGQHVNGIFLDPPYTQGSERLYKTVTDSKAISDAVRKWCIKNTNYPKTRIILAGYHDEHDELLNYGWQKLDSRAGGGRGYSNRRENKDSSGDNAERLWCSPQCLNTTERLF